MAAPICGDDTHCYRRAKDLVAFFRRAGWAVTDDFDGNTRRAWMTSLLREHRHDTAAVTRILLRLPDRRECPGDEDSADEVR